MTLDLTILTDIALILILSKIFGEIAERARFPAMLGELAAGFILGILMLVKPGEFMNSLASFGILFLFFMLGMKMSISDIKKDINRVFLITASGTLLSFITGFAIGYFIFLDAYKGLFLGVAIMSTSTAITLRMLNESGEINTKLFNLASAVSRIDDVFVVLMIAVITSLMLTGAQSQLIVSFVIVLFVFLLLEKWIANYIGRAFAIFRKLRDENMIIAVSLVALFMMSFLSEQIGIGGVIGAFLTGFALSKSKIAETDIMPKMKTIGYGFFIPIFFTYAAVSVDFSYIYNSLWLAVIMLILAISAKFFGTFFFAWREGHNIRDSSLLGISLIPRGEYAISIAYIALFSKFIDSQIYSATVIFVFLTIIIAPIIFRVAKRQEY